MSKSSHLPPLTPPLAQLLRKLSACGGLWLVGGAVRDCLCGRIPSDVDVLSALDAERIVRIAEPLRLRVVWRNPVREHGLVRLLAPGTGECIDVKALGLGEVTADSEDAQRALNGDLKARDLTINAMALPLDASLTLDTRKLCDPQGGQGDLARGLLRPCGALRARLEEDPLRVLRLARFLASDATWQLRGCDRTMLRAYVPQLLACSAERRHVEVERGLGSPCPWRMVRALAQWHALGALGADEDTSQRQGLRAARWLEQQGDRGVPMVQRLALLWFALTSPSKQPARPRVERSMQALLWSRALRISVVTLVDALQPHFVAARGHALARFWLQLGEPLREHFLALARLLPQLGVVDAAELSAWRRRTTQLLGTSPIPTRQSLAVDGRVLMRTLGIAAGPALKCVLDELLVWGTLHGCVADRAALLAHARRKMRCAQEL